MKYLCICMWLENKMGRYTIITNEHRSYRRIIDSIIKRRQNGLCYFCRLKIEDDDILVSRGHSNKHYYHKTCAERLHIVTFWLLDVLMEVF